MCLKKPKFPLFTIKIIHNIIYFYELKCPYERFKKIQERWNTLYGNRAIIVQVNEPTTISEALQTGEDSGNWKSAMERNFLAMHGNEVWKLVDIPENKTRMGR